MIEMYYWNEQALDDIHRKMCCCFMLGNFLACRLRKRNQADLKKYQQEMFLLNKKIGRFKFLN